MHKPIIAAINGYAVGGGFSLSLACHIRCSGRFHRLDNRIGGTDRA